MGQGQRAVSVYGRAPDRPVRHAEVPLPRLAQWRPCGEAVNDVLRDALTSMLDGVPGPWTADDDQRHAILVDLLWKVVRKDYHGVADCAMDLRELRL